MKAFLLPVLALVIWTFVIWCWMYATRIPAMNKARIDVKRIKRKADLDVLPTSVQQIADNYNHLHEQPTVFYALMFFSFLAGLSDPLNLQLAWAYVVIRVIHSFIQCTVNFVPVRFVFFSMGSIVLMVMTARNVLFLMAGH